MINITRETDRAVYEVTGRLTPTNAAEFESELLDALREDFGRRVFIDMKNLEYICSAGLRSLLKAAKSGYTFELTGIEGEVWETFYVTGFSEIFHIPRPEA